MDPAFILVRVLDLVSLLILARVVMSWIRVGEDHPIGSWIYRLTEPLMAPLRRVIPAVGGLDFTPMILLFGVQMLKRLVVF